MQTAVSWDYLIVTASNDAQGAAYENLLALRQRRGLLPQFRHVMVVTDLEGKRIGSGGSTLLCITNVVNRELETVPAAARTPQTVERILRRLRILIVHAGGDSRRLPAYSPCGKIFIPVPAATPSAGSTIFDRLLPSYLTLPPPPAGAGQVMAVSGDALLQFDPSPVRMDLPGLIALGSLETPEDASKHGVFVSADTAVDFYLQKPTPAEQAAAGAVRPDGRSVLDIGVMSFDAEAVLTLFRAFEIAAGPSGELAWSPAMRHRILTNGLDLYREICCALGQTATLAHYLKSVRSSGSSWETAALHQVFDALRAMPFHLQVVPECRFMHFGTTRQLITSGVDLMAHDAGAPPARTTIVLNSTVKGDLIAGAEAWVEGCSVKAPLELRGQNVMIGVDVLQSLSLPAGACLDIAPGRSRAGRPVHFVRCYHIGDTFKDSTEKGGTFCGRPLLHWMEAVGVPPSDVWPPADPETPRSLWNARVFPAVTEHAAYRDWLWMFDVERATPAQKRAFATADRYSAAEVALLTDQAAFHARRQMEEPCATP
jgi:fucokinase